MIASPHILVVEDDREISRLVSRYLRDNDCRVTLAGHGREMEQAIEANRIDLVVLDLMLPGEDGLSLCGRLRSRSQLPVIMLTARDSEIDRIVGLEIGADDYLTKPFNPRELLARIRAVLRRTATAAPDTRAARMMTFTGWRLDCVMRTLTDPQGARVTITSAEFDLLRAFCERPRRVLSREQLLDFTQGRSSGSLERSIDVLVSRLRRKLEVDPARPDVIKTVRAGGYVFTTAVEAT